MEEFGSGLRATGEEEKDGNNSSNNNEEEEGNFTATTEKEERFRAATREYEERSFITRRDAEAAESREQQVTAPPQAAVFLLKLRVVDALNGQPLSAVSVKIYVNFSHTSSAQTQENGQVWFNVPHRDRAVISAVATKRRYVPTLLPITTDKVPVFSSVTVPLLGVNRGNMWLFNDSVLVSSKSTGVFGAQPVVQFPRAALNLTEDNALSAVNAFMNSPSLSPPEGALLHTMGIASSKSGPVAVDLTPVASVFVQLLSSSSSSASVELNVTGPISLSLALCESCGLQEGDHVPAWALNHTSGAWVRRGLGTVQSIDGRLVWTYAVPHLGHWMAAPLSPSRGVRLEHHVDFLLRHGSFLMILLGSTLTVAVCLLVGLLCCPRSHHKETKARRPAVNPLLALKDQSTSTCEDRLFLHSNGLDHGQYNVAIYDPGVITNPSADVRQTKDNTVALTFDYQDEETLRNDPQQLSNGFFFYNQPVAILHAPGFFQLEEMSTQQWSSKSASLPRMQDDATETKISNVGKENEKKVGLKPDVKSRAHGGFPGSVSEPGTLGQTVISAAQGPRAWFVSLEGKPAAEIRYSRENSLDSGLDLTEPSQAKRDAKLERNTTFVKKSGDKQQREEKQ